MKRFLIRIIVILLILLLLVAGINTLADPFGVFGDPLMHCKTYSASLNPAIPQAASLDVDHSRYNAFLIGNAGCDSLDIDMLNRTYQADFACISMIHPDLTDCEKTAAYALEHYGAKRIIVCIGLDGLCRHRAFRTAAEMLPQQISAISPVLYYGKFLFASPFYGIKKTASYVRNSTFFSVMEPAGYDFMSYKESNPNAVSSAAFDIPKMNIRINCEQSLASVGRIKALCEQYGADFTFVLLPMYADALDKYVGDDLNDFLTGLARITDFWDFSGYHDAAYEPRWFSDLSVFCESVGKMITAVMCSESLDGIPDGFGIHVSAEDADNMERYTRHSEESVSESLAAHDAAVPILMYHHISDEFQSSVTVTTEQFRSHMEALYNAGYTAVSFHDLVNFVDTGKPLPEKPIVITFDDGYSSNLEYGAPILAQYGFCAEVAVIGESLGLKTETLSFFTPEEALNWVKRGVLEIGSHSWGFHHTDPRSGIYQMDGESDSDYFALLESDTAAITSVLTEAYGEMPLVYAYPYGYHSQITENVIHRAGYRVTLSVEPGMNTVTRGLPQTLRTMKRLNVPDTMTAAELLTALENLK